MTTRSISWPRQTPHLGMCCSEQERVICKDLVRQEHLKASDRHLEKGCAYWEHLNLVKTNDFLYSQKRHGGLVNCVRMQGGQTQWNLFTLHQAFPDVTVLNSHQEKLFEIRNQRQEVWGKKPRASLFIHIYFLVCWKELTSDLFSHAHRQWTLLMLDRVAAPSTEVPGPGCSWGLTEGLLSIMVSRSQKLA